MFQKMMDTVLQGIPGVCCYIDDIIGRSADEVTHLKLNLSQTYLQLLIDEASKAYLTINPHT